MQKYRYALLEQRQTLVHRTNGDETKLTVCGVLGASLSLRFDRPTAATIKRKPLCRNCATIIASRARR